MFLKSKKEELEEVKMEHAVEILKNSTEIGNLKQSLSESEKKLEEKDKEIKRLNSKINLLKSQHIESVNDVDFVGCDEGVGTYLENVEVYDEIDLYRIGEMYNSSGDKFKIHRKSWEKGSITISLKVSSGYSSKKEVFDAIKRVYPKLLEYFRE